MSEAPVDKEAQKLQQGHETPIQKRTLELKNCNPKPDPNDLKKDESNEQNTDSNKSNHVFQTPNPHSSSGSANRDFEYQSTPRRNNLNFLLGESNGKKSQTQKKILHHSKYFLLKLVPWTPLSIRTTIIWANIKEFLHFMITNCKIF
jgi:hypothetical protein